MLKFTLGFTSGALVGAAGSFIALMIALVAYEDNEEFREMFNAIPSK